MKKLFTAVCLLLCIACAAFASGEIEVTVGKTCDIIGYSDAEESVWYSEDDAIATVSGGMSSCTVTGVSVGSVNIIHRYVCSEPFSEYDPDLGKTVNGTRSVTKKDYYSVVVKAASFEDVFSDASDSDPVDEVTSPTSYVDEYVDETTSPSEAAFDPIATAEPRADGTYAYKIYVTEEAKREMKKYDTLKPGDKGKKVKQMKERLVELGYLWCEGKITNKYDDATEMAVYDFQIYNNLTGSDGIAYSYTLYKLYSEFAIPQWGYYYSTLQIGDEGWEVENMQRRLCDLGYLDEEYVNGDFQVDTMDAVRIFQQNNGFEDDGVAHYWQLEVMFTSQINSYGVD